MSQQQDSTVRNRAVVVEHALTDRSIAVNVEYRDYRGLAILTVGCPNREMADALAAQINLSAWVEVDEHDGNRSPRMSVVRRG